MTKHIDAADLPEDIANRVNARLASGGFASAEDVIRAGVEALDERDEAARDWLAYAQQEAADGFAELDRGEGIKGTVDEHMARIDRGLGDRLNAVDV
jgi:Arc/MetJ-type ribon-helix-helix transcriptional regulator